MKESLILFLLTMMLGISGAVFGQFPQMKRSEERRQTMIQADEERQRAERNGKPAQPVTPAIMNVDVQMVFTKLEYKTFALAKPFNMTTIADGDPVWLYIKFNGNLGKYVHTMPNPDGGDRYVLFVEFGPKDDVTAKSHQLLEFRKDELTLTELKMSLAPGKAGHNKALPIFIKNVGASRPGLWSNELRVSRTPGFPRSPNDYLAKAGFTNDFSKGVTKYPAMTGVFRSMVLRDSTDESVVPVAGKFDNLAIRTALAEKLASEGIAPSRIYFSGDVWLEYSDHPINTRQFRTVTAVFEYRKEGKCFYGTADITQTYQAMNDNFGDPVITLKKDISTSCIAAPDAAVAK